MATREITGARHALLSKLIDHAALFPPASLPMEAAIEVDRWARGTPQAWILNRFLVPASHLVELPEGFDPPLGVIVDVDELPPLSAQVDVVEARLERAPATEGVDARVFLEIWPGDEAALDTVRERGAGAKVRCGGPTPDMFPSPAELAALHLRLPRPRARLQGHGRAAPSDPRRDRARLPQPARRGRARARRGRGSARPDPGAARGGRRRLRGDDEAFTVRGHAHGAGAVAAAREALFVGYGSCSFSEPVEDLRGLRVL